MTEKTQKDETTSAADLAASTLTGDIRDFLLDRVKRLGKPWVAMSEDEQADQIHAAKEAAEHLVKQVCHIIASDGRKAVVGELRKVTQDTCIKVVIEFSKQDEQRHAIWDAQGQTVLLVVAGADTFTGERGPAEPDPDQGSLLDKAEKLKKSSDKVTSIKR